VKVVSIVSACRSGSTLLDMLLGSVDGFFSAGELRELWERGIMEQRLCGCGLTVSDCPVWSEVLSAPGLADLDPVEVVDWQHRVARVRHTRRLLRARAATARDPRLSKLSAAMTSLYEVTGRVTGARVIVDSSKRPADAALCARLPGIETYVIHLVRDPRAVAYSQRRRKQEFDHETRVEMERWNVGRAAANWLWLNSVASTIPYYAPTLPFLRLRYEDLLAEPEATLDDLLEFIGEPNATAPVHDGVATLEANHTVSGNPSRFSTGTVDLRADEEWRSAMATAPWCAATAISAPAIPKFGYDIGTGAPWHRSRVKQVA
jgi:Sulfotransferase family